MVKIRYMDEIVNQAKRETSGAVGNFKTDYKQNVIFIACVPIVPLWDFPGTAG